MASTEGNGSKSSLMKLPNELFFDVASHLNSFKDLNSLVRTCRFFHTMFNTQLYRRAVAADRKDLDGIVGRVLSRYRRSSLALLLDNGLSVNYTGRFPFHRNQSVETMLRFVCALPNQECSVRLARLLLQRGANIEAKRSRSSGTPLQRAVSQGNCMIASLLLEHGADANAMDLRGVPTLHFACDNDMGKDSAEMIHLLIEHGANVDARSTAGDTALTAIGPYHPNVMEALLEHGAAVDVHNNRGETPLHHAAKWFNGEELELAELLLEHGAIVDARDMYGETPLHWAIKDHVDDGLSMAEFLLENGANANAISRNGLTPLQCALDSYHHQYGEDIVALLLEYGADVDETDLHLVLESPQDDDVSVAKLLLEKGADVNEVMDNGLSPLQYVLEEDQFGEAMVALLLDYGADVNVTDEDGRTPLHCILESPNDDLLCVARLLLENGADVNEVMNDGRRPLQYVLEDDQFWEGRDVMVELLLEYGADVNETDENGRTPLHWLLESPNGNNVLVAQLLLENGADVNAVSNDGRRPLQYALENKDCEVSIVELLLDYGAIVHVTDHCGRTPLHWLLEAHLGDELSIAKLLLEKGANVNAVSNDWLSVLKCALDEGYDADVVLLLLEHGADVTALNREGWRQLGCLLQSTNRGHRMYFPLCT
jgi:ankyrin repeat protein